MVSCVTSNVTSHTKISKEEIEHELPDVLVNIVSEYLASQIIFSYEGNDIFHNSYVVYEDKKYYFDEENGDHELQSKTVIKRGFDNGITLYIKDDIVVPKEPSEEFYNFLHDCTTDDQIRFITIPKEEKEGVISIITYVVSYEFDLTAYEECFELMEFFDTSNFFTGPLPIVPRRCYHRGKNNIKEFSLEDLSKYLGYKINITFDIESHGCILNFTVVTK